MNSAQKVELVIDRIFDIFKEENVTMEEANAILKGCNITIVTYDIAGVKLEDTY